MEKVFRGCHDGCYDIGCVEVNRANDTTGWVYVECSKCADVIRTFTEHDELTDSQVDEFAEIYARMHLAENHA